MFFRNDNFTFAIMNLLYFILCAYGLTNILVYSAIFDSIRPENKFFHCPMCIGFWVGWFIWIIQLFCPSNIFYHDNALSTGFFLACLSSGTSYLLSMVVGDEGIIVNNKYF